MQLRHRHPFWGPRKLKKRLGTLHPNQTWPASSTIGSILKHHGLARPRRKRSRTPIYVGPLAKGVMPNDVWAADFKGWFKTTDGTRIDPLTVTDLASRYLIHCRTLKQETANPPRSNPREQQKAFDRFKGELNEERPHESIDLKTPVDVYASSPRQFPRKLPELEYPAGSVTRLVLGNGTIKVMNNQIYASNALIGQPVRIEETDAGQQNIWYGPVLLGELDLKNEMIRRTATKVLPMCPV